MPQEIHILFTTASTPPFRGAVGDIVRARIKEFNYQTTKFLIVNIEETEDVDTGETLYVYYGVIAPS